MLRVEKNSSFHPHLTVSESTIHGNGLFASKLIAESDVLVMFGGTIFNIDDIRKGLCDPKTTIAISEKQWLGNLFDAAKEPDDYINHSCLPNAGLRDALTLVATKNVEAGDEIVVDYSVWVNDPGYLLTENCLCGSSNCRKRITGNDWMRLDVIKQNIGFYSPFLNARISALLKPICSYHE